MLPAYGQFMKTFLIFFLFLVFSLFFLGGRNFHSVRYCILYLTEINLWTLRNSVESLHLRNNDHAGRTTQINRFEHLANDKKPLQEQKVIYPEQTPATWLDSGICEVWVWSYSQGPPPTTTPHPPFQPGCGEKTPEHCGLWRDPNALGAPWAAQSPEQKLFSTLGKSLGNENEFTISFDSEHSLGGVGQM